MIIMIIVMRNSLRGPDGLRDAEAVPDGRDQVRQSVEPKRGVVNLYSKPTAYYIHIYIYIYIERER